MTAKAHGFSQTQGPPDEPALGRMVTDEGHDFIRHPRGTAVSKEAAFTTPWATRLAALRTGGLIFEDDYGFEYRYSERLVSSTSSRSAGHRPMEAWATPLHAEPVSQPVPGP